VVAGLERGDARADLAQRCRHPHGPGSPGRGLRGRRRTACRRRCGRRRWPITSTSTSPGLRSPDLDGLDGHARLLSSDGGAGLHGGAGSGWWRRRMVPRAPARNPVSQQAHHRQREPRKGDTEPEPHEVRQQIGQHAAIGRPDRHARARAADDEDVEADRRRRQPDPTTIQHQMPNQIAVSSVVRPKSSAVMTGKKTGRVRSHHGEFVHHRAEHDVDEEEGDQHAIGREALLAHPTPPAGPAPERGARKALNTSAPSRMAKIMAVVSAVALRLSTICRPSASAARGRPAASRCSRPPHFRSA